MYLVFVICILITSHELVNGQNWITPMNRVAYGQNSQPITLEWELNRGGKSIALATWQLIDPDKGDSLSQTIVFLDTNGDIRTSAGVSSTEFGKVTIDSLDSGIYKKVKVTVEFVGADQIIDFMIIQYVSDTPSFTNQVVNPTYAFNEVDVASKNIVMEVTSKGNPEPIVVWTIDGKDVRTFPGFVVENTTVADGNGEFQTTSVLRIAHLTGDYNGELKGVTKYGTPGESSPQSEVTSLIDIKFAPRNLVFTHNITNNVVINEGYIWLKCKADGNPPPTFTIKDGADLISSKSTHDHVVYLNQYHHTRRLHYICTANNTLGTVHSPVLELQIVNGTLTGKRYGEEDESWLVYFGVGCAVAFILFIGVFVTLCVIRRRMRSLNLRDGINRVKMRDSQQQQQQQQNGHNHVYDLNERGRRGTAQRYDTRARQVPQPDRNMNVPTINTPHSGIENNAYENELYDEVSGR